MSRPPRIAIVAATCFALLVESELACGQGPKFNNAPSTITVATIPGPGYFAALELYRLGQFREAAAALSVIIPAANMPRPVQLYRWGLGGLTDSMYFHHRAARTASAPLDDVCYFTMRGECSYQLGAYPAALLDYQAALMVHLCNLRWLETITMPGAVSVLGAPGIPWGMRGSAPGDFPATVTMTSRFSFPARSVNVQGRRPVATTIYVQEIVRCTCLALYRWYELMGPLSEYHPFSIGLNQNKRMGHKRPSMSTNPWAEVWLRVEGGMISALEGKPAEAIPKLEQSALFGALDHPLTGYALLLLGRLSQDKPDVADNYYVQASLAAARYGDLTVVEEALRAGAEMHLAAGQKTKYAPLEAAVVWAAGAGSPPLEVTLLLLAAENDYQLGLIESATARLVAATALVTGTEMATGRIGARLGYLNALVAYSQQNALDGEPALQASLAYQRLGSFWQFRAGMVELACATKTVPEHKAGELYASVFGGPTQADWLTGPQEALSSLVIPHPWSYERWFELPSVQRDSKLAFDIAERTRRHRFLSTLDLGGRTLALRWVLEAPERSLNRLAIDERPQIQIRAARYEEVSRHARELLAELRKLPLVPEEPEEVKQQKKLSAELKRLVVEQEAMLRQLALERQDCELIFPPLKTTDQIQAELGEGQGILAFLETYRQVHAFLLTKNGLLHWQLELPPQKLAARIRALLEQWGNHTANKQLTHRDLSIERWHETASLLFNELTNGSKTDFSTIKELIVVPDGELWYLPFEALTVPGNISQPLLTRMRLRYAPTAGLATGDTRPHKPGVTAVLAAHTLSHEQRETEAERLSQFEQASPDMVPLPPKLKVEPALLASLIDQLVVYREVPAASEVYYQWQPIQAAAHGPTSTLSDWMTLPWAGPDQTMLIGFHSPAERPRKALASGTAANELFLSICGLMACGSRTVLISRWRTAGQTNYDLVRQFAEALPTATAAEAWQRAMQTVTAAPLAPHKEPRLKHEHGATEPLASHPFFWAGLLLSDTGSPPVGN